MLPALIVGALTAWYLGLRAGIIAAVVTATALLVAMFVPIPGITLAIGSDRAGGLLAAQVDQARLTPAEQAPALAVEFAILPGSPGPSWGAIPQGFGLERLVISIS